MSRSIFRDCPYLLQRISFVDQTLCPGYLPILERDLDELIRGIAASSWKSSLLLCGSLLEGCLYCFLKRNEHYIQWVTSDQHYSIDPEGGLTYFLHLFRRHFGVYGIDVLPDAVIAFRDIVHPNAEVMMGDTFVSQGTVAQATTFVNRLLKEFGEFRY